MAEFPPSNPRDDDPTIPYESPAIVPPKSAKRVVEQTLCGMIAAILWAFAALFLVVGVSEQFRDQGTVTQRVSETAAFIVIIALLSMWGWHFTKRMLGRR